MVPACSCFYYYFVLAACSVRICAGTDTTCIKERGGGPTLGAGKERRQEGGAESELFGPGGNQGSNGARQDEVK
ncbi:hypothetical protein CGRA01v4_04458 [Colletotrichum graminicola]|nr:hypothetical protein CGRA01v4_04458 [Colletotrichum graminicola]